MPSMSPIINPILQSQIPTLKLAFPKVIITAPGQSIAKALAQSAPILHLRTLDPGKTYIAVSLDPNTPVATFSFLGPILHSCQTDLTGADAHADEDGWTRLAAINPAAVS
jgi:hypothetical protein